MDIGAIFRRPGASDNRGQPVGTPASQPGTPPAAVPGSSGMPNTQPNPRAGEGTPDNPDLNNTDPSKGKNDSPLDAFKDIFTIDPEKEKNRPKDPFSEKLLNLDPKKLGEAASKMDFVRGVDPALVQKALQGDVQSFSAVLNHATRAAFMQSASMVTSLVESAIGKNNERINSVLPDRIRNSMLGFSRPENTALQHPAAQPVLAALKEQVARQMPDLGPEEIARKAEEYFLAMADAVTAGKKPATDVNDEPKETNWTDFLTGSGSQ